MRRLELSDGVLATLTDAAPAPAAFTASFPNADIADHPGVVARWLPDEKFHTRFTVFAFTRGGRTLLIDAGVGREPSPYFNGLAGRLLEEMQAAGIDPATVDLLMFTHFHLDHVGWATRPDGEPFFANARYVAPAAELAHWAEHGERALPHHVEAYAQRIQPLLRAGLLVGHDADVALAAQGWPDVRYKAAIGHTAGHHAVVIGGAEETLLIAGDAWHSPAQVAVPAWGHRADRDPDQARRSREALAAWACENGAIVAAGHFPEDRAFGRVVRDGARYAYAPLDR